MREALQQHHRLPSANIYIIETKTIHFIIFYTKSQQNAKKNRERKHHLTHSFPICVFKGDEGSDKLQREFDIRIQEYAVGAFGASIAKFTTTRSLLM